MAQGVRKLPGTETKAKVQHVEEKEEKKMQTKSLGPLRWAPNEKSILRWYSKRKTRGAWGSGLVARKVVKEEEAAG